MAAGVTPAGRLAASRRAAQRGRRAARCWPRSTRTPGSRERNLDRYDETGKVDWYYLQGLSADAVPVLADSPGRRGRVRADGARRQRRRLAGVEPRAAARAEREIEAQFEPPRRRRAGLPEQRLTGHTHVTRRVLRALVDHASYRRSRPGRHPDRLDGRRRARRDRRRPSRPTAARRGWTAQVAAAKRADALVAAMSTEQKLHMVTFGDPPWFLYYGVAGHVPASGAVHPRPVLSDAGSGVAGMQYGTTTFPSGVAQAATWDPRCSGSSAAPSARRRTPRAST